MRSGPSSECSRWPGCDGVDKPVALVALVLILLLVVVPVIRAIAQAVATGNAWSPFERREHGRPGPLTLGRYFSSLRAPREGQRTTLGLVARWGFWAAFIVVFGGGSAYNAFLR